MPNKRMKSLVIELPFSEARFLDHLAKKEMRTPENLAAYLVKRGLSLLNAEINRRDQVIDPPVKIHMSDTETVGIFEEDES